VIAAQSFAPTANPTTAAIYALTAGALVFPAKTTAYLSGYISSKFAQIRLIEYLAAENPNLFCVSVHPGMVDTEIFRGSGANKDELPMDTRES
jgi:NAD(P)-dependent dehydrogenase (short-subunit alcohol dehydrogenase family)